MQGLMRAAQADAVVLLFGASMTLPTPYAMWAVGLRLEDRPMLVTVGLSLLATVLLPAAVIAVQAFGRVVVWGRAVAAHLQGRAFPEGSLLWATRALKGPLVTGTALAFAVGIVAFLVWGQTLAYLPDPYAAPQEAMRTLFMLHEAWTGALLGATGCSRAWCCGGRWCSRGRSRTV